MSSCSSWNVQWNPTDIVRLLRQQDSCYFSSQSLVCNSPIFCLFFLVPFWLFCTGVYCFNVHWWKPPALHYWYSVWKCQCRSEPAVVRYGSVFVLALTANGYTIFSIISKKLNDDESLLDILCPIKWRNMLSLPVRTPSWQTWFRISRCLPHMGPFLWRVLSSAMCSVRQEYNQQIVACNPQIIAIWLFFEACPKLVLHELNFMAFHSTLIAFLHAKFFILKVHGERLTLKFHKMTPNSEYMHCFVNYKNYQLESRGIRLENALNVLQVWGYMYSIPVSVGHPAIPTYHNNENGSIYQSHWRDCFYSSIRAYCWVWSVKCIPLL